MNTGRALLGVLAGIAAGAEWGILYAPDKGANTRKKILKKRDETSDDLSEKFNEFIELITSKFETLKEEAARVAENGRAAKSNGAGTKATGVEK